MKASLSLKKVAKNIAKISQTITIFMEFSNPSRDTQLFIMRDSIESIQNMLEAQLFCKNIEFVNGCGESLLLETYKNNLKQVTINLINNAKDAFDSTIQTKKTIQIHAKEDTNNVNIEKNIFDSHCKAITKENRIGLGLFISQNHHRSTLWENEICK